MKNKEIELLLAFIKEKKDYLLSGFYTQYFANIMKISLKTASNYLKETVKLNIFTLFYEIRCPDCDCPIKFVKYPERINFDDIECEGDCLKDVGEPVKKKITIDDCKLYFVLNPNGYNILNKIKNIREKVFNKAKSELIKNKSNNIKEYCDFCKNEINVINDFNIGSIIDNQYNIISTEWYCSTKCHIKGVEHLKKVSEIWSKDGYKKFFYY